MKRIANGFGTTTLAILRVVKFNISIFPLLFSLNISGKTQLL